MEMTASMVLEMTNFEDRMEMISFVIREMIEDMEEMAMTY